MKEIVETERGYVKSLKFVVDHYMSELLREDVPPALRGKRNLVFGNLEQIHQFHSIHFLTKLENCRSPYHVCHFFLEHVREGCGEGNGWGIELGKGNGWGMEVWKRKGRKWVGNRGREGKWMGNGGMEGKWMGNGGMEGKWMGNGGMEYSKFDYGHIV